jgi:phosphatidate cytidylyltransferase
VTRSPADLGRRIVFGIVAVPIAVAIIYIGGVPLAAFLSVLAAIGTWELFRMARATGARPIAAVGIPFAILIPLAQAAAPAGVFDIAPEWAAAGVLLTLTLVLWLRRADAHPLGAAALTLFAPAYTAGMLTFGFAIRNHNYAVGRLAGTALVLFPVLLTWINDISAFAIGRPLGRQKLMPAVSPGKTVAGAIGGLACTIIAAWAYARWVLPRAADLALTPGGAIAFGIAVSVAAQLGDLFESLIKREASVKDSSTIFPGHGGVLDRLDSLFFVLPVAYLIFDIPGLLIPR